MRHTGAMIYLSIISHHFSPCQDVFGGTKIASLCPQTLGLHAGETMKFLVILTAMIFATSAWSQTADQLVNKSQDVNRQIIEKAETLPEQKRRLIIEKLNAIEDLLVGGGGGGNTDELVISGSVEGSPFRFVGDSTLAINAE